MSHHWIDRYEDGPEGKKPVEVCLVDLALTKWASPTTDLSYFLFMSTTPELRKAHMDEIMAYYHQTLTKALQDLGEDPNIISLRYTDSLYKYKHVGIEVETKNGVLCGHVC